LAALCEKPVRPPVPQKYLDGGYLESRQVPPDPWGRPYVFLAPGPDGEAFEIISYGADGEPGGEGENADISSEGK
jgi:general secretion pathway protein G